MSETNGQNGHPEGPLIPGGSGGKTERTESGRTILQDQRLLSIALKRGWYKGQRFATDANLDELRERKAAGQMTVKDQAVLTAMGGLTSGDGRVEQRAVSNVVAMERLNQADEFADVGIVQDGMEVNVNVTTIGVQAREDFYGNDAHAETAEALAASGQGLALGGPVQNGLLRETLGQNGDGTDGHDGRPRADAGDAEGGH